MLLLLPDVLISAMVE